MGITVDIMTARKNRQIIVPEKHDAFELIRRVEPTVPINLGVESIMFVGDYIYVIPGKSTAPLRRIHRTTFALEETTFNPGVCSNKALVEDDIHIYLTASSKVYKIDKTTFEKVAELSHGAGTRTYISQTDTHIYVAGEQTNPVVQQIEKSTFSSFTTVFTRAGYSITDVEASGDYLYIRAYKNFIKYRISTDSILYDIEYEDMRVSGTYGHGFFITSRYVFIPESYSNTGIYVLDADDLSLVTYIFDADNAKPISGEGSITKSENYAYYTAFGSGAGVVRIHTTTFEVTYIESASYLPHIYEKCNATDGELFVTSDGDTGAIEIRYLNASIPDFESDYITVDTTDRYQTIANSSNSDRVSKQHVFYTTINTILNNPDDFVITLPENPDASTYFNGVGAGMQFTIQDTVKGTVYNDNIPWPGIASLKQAGVANYATITG
jgi:hypothetical protein